MDMEARVLNAILDGVCKTRDDFGLDARLVFDDLVRKGLIVAHHYWGLSAEGLRQLHQPESDDDLPTFREMRGIFKS